MLPNEPWGTKAKAREWGLLGPLFLKASLGNYLVCAQPGQLVRRQERQVLLHLPLPARKALLMASTTTAVSLPHGEEQPLAELAYCLS